MFINRLVSHALPHILESPDPGATASCQPAAANLIGPTGGRALTRVRLIRVTRFSSPQVRQALQLMKWSDSVLCC